jgi:hypothetical protein
MRTLIFMLIVVLFIACEKEYTPTGTQANGKPPIANAGKDFSVTIPDEIGVLTGAEISGFATSYRAYYWNQLNSTPLLAFYRNESSGKATPIFLQAGNYQFQLRARNASGEDFDTVAVNVKWAPRCNADREMIEGGRFIPIGSVLDSIPRSPTIVVGNGKLIFVGGIVVDPYWDDVPYTVLSSRLVTFDPVTRKYTAYTLSVPRVDVTAASVGELIFAAGGNEDLKVSDLVEILDQTTGKFIVHKLSVARYAMTSAVVGHLVFFAGGYNAGGSVSDVVDIYDLDTDSWSVAKLSLARANISTVVAGNKIFFGGGTKSGGLASDIVDVYDVVSRSWSTLKLSEARLSMQGAFFDGKVIFAGGFIEFDGNLSKSIDIIDPLTQTSTQDCLVLECFNPSNREGVVSTTALAVGDRLYINDGGHLAFKEKSSHKWMYSVGPNANIPMFTVGNSIYAFVLQHSGPNLGKYEISRFNE